MGLTWLHQFSEQDGNSVRGALVQVSDRWYGLAGEAGPNGTPECNSGANWSTVEHTRHCPGTLFSVGIDGLRVEHAFTQLDGAYHNYDGYHPYGSLVAGYDGWLYGVTQMGGTPPIAGARGSGVLFRFNPTGGAFEVLHHFYSSARPLDGLYPMGAPAPLPDGRVCGTTKDGGLYNTGTAWCWYPDSDFDYASIPAFVGGAVGGVAYAGGMLHGVTNWGGTAGKGTYFTFDPDSLVVTVVASFPDYERAICCDDNTPIVVPLVLSDKKTLVIAREFGGTGPGLIAKLDSAGIHVLRDLAPLEPNHQGQPYRFGNTTGGMPNGLLVEGCDGGIYGSTLYGGFYGAGAIYRIDRDGSGFRLHYSFGFDSGYPYGGLARGSDCALVGTTFVNGRIFRFVPGDVCL